MACFYEKNDVRNRLHSSNFAHFYTRIITTHSLYKTHLCVPVLIHHNLIKKFPSIHHNRKINKPNRQKLGLICPMTYQQKTRLTPLGEAYYAKLKAKSILMNKKKEKNTMLKIFG